MKYSMMRKIALILITVMLSMEVLSPVFAAEEGLTNNNVIEDVASQESSGQTDPAEVLNNMTEEEQQAMLEDAYNNVENALKRQSSENALDEGTDAGSDENNNKTVFESSALSEVKAVSDSGNVRVDMYTDEEGEKNYLFNGSENLNYDASKEGVLPGYEYVGTGDESGMDVYKTVMTYEELDACYDEDQEELEYESEETDEVIEYFNRESLTEEEIEEAIDSADEFSADVREECFIYVASISEATGSEAFQKYIERKRAEALGIYNDDDAAEQASVSEASNSEASSSEAGSEAESSEANSGGGINPYLDGALFDDTSSDYDLSDEASVSDALYVNNIVGDDWVQIAPTKNIYTDDIIFDQTTIKEFDSEDDYENDTYSQKETQVLIARKDIVYFQVNQLDKDGKKIGGLNNAAVYIEYKDSLNRTQKRSGVTARVDEHDGYIAFDKMKGMYDCFINISFPGDATQTYYTLYVEGGNCYEFNMRSVKKGDIYLRSAGLDGVDIMTFGYRHTLSKNAVDSQYNFSYMVDVYDPSGESKTPEKVYLVSEPQRPEGWKFEEEKDSNKRKKYRDKVYHFGSELKTVRGQESRKFTMRAPWSQVTDIDKVPEYCPQDGDDPKDTLGFGGTRLVPDSKTYLEINGDGVWSENGQKRIQLLLEVKDPAPGWERFSSFTVNAFGVPTSTGQSGTGIKFNTDIPGLKNVEINVDLFSFNVMVACIPSGYLIGGYLVPGPMAELINTYKTFAKQDLIKSPKVLWKAGSIKEQFTRIWQQYNQNSSGMRRYINSLREKYENTSKKQWTGNLSGGLVGYFMVAGEFNWKQGLYGATVTAGVCAYGVGDVTGYAFIGPVPRYVGMSCMGSATFSIGCGVQVAVTDSGHYTRFSPGTSIGIDLSIGVTAFAGLGIRNFLGAEVTGGGNIGGSFKATANPNAPPVQITGGWDIGLRAYICFVRWKSTIVSKNYQLYPKKDNTDSAAGDSPEDASESQLEDFKIVVPVAEGRAQKQYSNDADGGYTETFEAYSECNGAGEYTDETQVAKTTEIASSVVASSNIRYASGKKNGGILARIANVETKCADGKTRVIPRVVWARVREKEIEQKFTGVVNTISIDEKQKEDFEEWERQYEYGYDYSFDVQMFDDDYVDITIVSGPVNQEELDQEAAKEAQAKGEDVKKAIVRCRAANQHIRVYRLKINGETQYLVNSKIAPKKTVYDEKNKCYTHEYVYAGTPATSTFKAESSLSHFGEISTWVACPINLDIFNNQQLSSGYMITNWLGDNFERNRLLDSTVCVDGISRTKMLISSNELEEDPRYPGERNSVCVFSLISDGNGSTTSKTIQRAVWRTYYYAFRTEAPRTIAVQDNITNFSHVNSDSRKDIYYTSGGKLYCLDRQFKISELKMTSDAGNEVDLQGGDGSLAYLRSKRTDGTEKLNIIAINNEQSYDRAKPVEGEDAQIKTNASIVIYDFQPDGDNKLICKGKNISDMKDKYILRFDAAFTQMGEYDTESSIKVYYLANYREETVQSTVYDSIGGDTEIKTVHEKCDLFVWNWVADYGATIVALTPATEVVPYGSKSFALKMTYKNNGPRYINGGVKVSYILRKGGKDEQPLTVEVDGDIKSGETKEKTINIPIPKDKKWDGWVTVKAQITEVKVDGKWITSNEAGFKPVWVESDKLKGKINLGCEKRGDDCHLAVKEWDAIISKPENLAVKVYRQRTNASQSELTWESFPSAVIYLDTAQARDFRKYTWNCTFGTSNTRYWYGGMYKDAAGTIPITSRKDKVENIKAEELTTAVKFELCGFGDDTMNVTYSEVVINNPLLESLSVVSVTAVDPDAISDISGSGYYFSGSPFTVEWSVNEGYVLSTCAPEDPLSVKEPDLSGNRYHATITPGYNYVNLSLNTKPAADYYHVKAFVTTDNTGKPHAKICAKKIIGEKSYDLYSSSGTNEYTKFMIKNDEAVRTIVLTPEYDKSKYRFDGWYSTAYTATPGESGLITYESDMSSEDTEAVYETHYLPVGERISDTNGSESLYIFPEEYGKEFMIKAVFVPQNGKKITFDPNGGSLLGVETAYTSPYGYLSDADIKGRTASRGGYTFNGWYTSDGTKITTGYKFTADTTIYAGYTKLPEHDFIVTSNDTMVGKIEVDGQMQRSIQMRGYTGATFALRAYTDEDYELDAPVWRVYSKDSSGNYTIAESVVPEYDDGKNCYIYTMPDKDIKIIAQFKKKAAADAFYITLDTDKDDYGYPIATFSVAVPSKSTDYPEITALRDGRYKIAYDKAPESYTDIIVEANIFGDLADDYAFSGWREIITNPDGTKVLGDIISTDSRLVLEGLHSDKKLYAEWTKKEPQGITFAKSSVTIEGDFPGGTVNVLVPPTDRKVTYSCSNKSIIKVNPTTGELGTPFNSGTVVITANIAAKGIYASEKATYTLTVKKCAQKISFKKAEMTAALNDEPFKNEIEGAKSKVHYTSSNPAVAEVDYNTGYVTPNRVYGDAVITAVADGNGLYYESKATYKVHITGLSQDIFFSTPSWTVSYGCDLFTATPSGAEGTVTYRSSNTNVASVDVNTGKIRIKSSGKATISAVAAATDRYLKSNEAQYTITVNKASQNPKFATESCTVRIGERSFTNILKNAKTAVHYTSSNPTVASVNELTGVVTIGNTKGDAVITAVAEEDSRYKQANASYDVHVKGKVQFITFENKLVRKVYEDGPFTATPSGAVGTITYISTNPDVATVSATGEVTIVKPGETTIEAKAAATSQYEESNTARYTLIVEKRDQVLTLASTSMLATAGETITNSYSGNKTDVTFTSSNESVATVHKDGTSTTVSIYPKGNGTAVITAKASGNDCYNEAEVYFAVIVGRQAQDIYFDRAVVTTVATDTEVNNYLKNRMGRDVEYGSSDESIATVSAIEGKPEEHVLNIKKSGVVIITATASESGEIKTATASYILNIRKADPLMYFEEGIKNVSADSEPFTVTLKDAKTAVTYSSSDTDIATVDPSSGLVTLKGIQGETVITAEAPATDIYAASKVSYTVNVSRVPQVLHFSKPQARIVYLGGSYTATPSGAMTEVSYYSTKPGVASVDKSTGEVTPVHPGKARIYAIAKETDRYAAAAASYEIIVDKAEQDPYFEKSYVMRRLETEPFVNEINEAKGEVTYSSASPSIATVGSDGTIRVLKVGKTEITASVSESEYYAAAECSFMLDVIRAIQNPYFADENPSVTYGCGTYKNNLKGAKAAPEYSVIGYEPASGVPSGSTGATVDKSTGTVTVLNAGSVKIRATVPRTSRYESAAATYVLTIAPKSIKDTVISVPADFRGTVVVIDGTKVLEEGTDYRFRFYEKDLKTVYEVEGIGNYKDTVTKSETKKQYVEVTETYEPLVSEDIPASQQEEAQSLVNKVEITGFDISKAPVDEIKEQLISEGQISREDMNNAAFIEIVTDIKTTLESIDNANGEYKYKLDPWAVLLARMADGTIRYGYTQIKSEWLDGSRTIRVKLGVGNSSKELNRVIHQNDDGSLIQTYMPGTQASGTSFAYDSVEGTVELCIEHCSDIIIRHEDTPTPTPPTPTPTPTPVHGGGGGGFINASSSWRWFKDAEGYWHLKNDDHEYKDEWAYAYNGSADPAKGHRYYSWFSFDEKGRMRTGWFKDKTGKWYFLETKSEGNQGAMYEDCLTPDGYRVDKNGAWNGQPATVSK